MESETCYFVAEDLNQDVKEEDLISFFKESNLNIYN